MKKYFTSVIFITVIFWLSACSNSPVPSEAPLDPNQGKSYFFLEEGLYREYEVRKIEQTAVNPDDGDSTFTKVETFLIREEIREAYEAGDAEKAHLIYRYRWVQDPIDSVFDWVLQSVLSARINSNHAVLTENNRQTVKMVFPLDTIQSWDKNAFNESPIDIIKAATFNEPYRVGFNTFSNASQIIFERDSNAVDAIDSYEVYADSIGLVHDYYRNVKFCNTCLGDVKPIREGRTISKRLTAFGRID